MLGGHAMHSLPLFVRLTGRSFILVGDGEAALAKRRLLDRAGAVVTDESGSAPLAIVAVDDEVEARAAIERLKARGILVNAVDRPALCDFTLPAIIDRDPVIIAIGTGGASAGLAKALRQRLEGLIPAGLGAVADALKQARPAIKSRWGEPSERRRAIDAALDPGGPLDPLSAANAMDVDAWIAAPNAAGQSAFHRLIIASDDPDDLTIRQARLLGQADHVYHVASIAPAILDRARADAARTCCESPPDQPSGGVILFLDRA
jgi:uroporphyrin-III C-methyltransferase / precorrin-2 dehydrogenase / sirohydrochlorin ferrochelatase